MISKEVLDIPQNCGQVRTKFIQKQEEYKGLVLQHHNLHFIREYCSFLESKIELEKRCIDIEVSLNTKGRGGNNTAENIKKSLLSIIRKVLSKQLYLVFKAQCIQKHGICSQKENIIIFYLYLHKFYTQGFLEYKIIEQIQKQLKEKITKYIRNSKDKLELEQQRKHFHQKNIEEFQKFMEIDVDFREKRLFHEIILQIKRFYLRKTIEFQKSIDRLKKVIKSDRLFTSLFSDMKSEIPVEQSQSPMKQEETEPLIKIYDSNQCLFFRT